MTEPAATPDPLATEKLRRRRSTAIALTLALMVLAFYVATLVRFGDAIATKTL